MRISDWSSDVCSSDLLKNYFCRPESASSRLRVKQLARRLCLDRCPDSRANRTYQEQMMRESSPSLAGLRKRIARIAASGGFESRPAEGWLASGHARFDAAIGGGLADRKRTRLNSSH